MDTPKTSQADAPAISGLPKVAHGKVKQRGRYRRWLTNRAQLVGRSLARLVFDADGSPRAWVRPLVFDRYRRPRPATASLVLRRNGEPKRAFAQWMADADVELLPLVEHLRLPPSGELRRDVALVVCHGSTAGAARLVEALSQQYAVVLVLIDGDEMERAPAHLVPFTASGSRVPRSVLLSALALRLRDLQPRVAVAVGAATADAALACELREIPVVFLANPGAPETMLREVTEVVFPSHAARGAAEAAFPGFAGRDYLHVVEEPLGAGADLIRVVAGRAARRVEDEVALALTAGPDRLEILTADRPDRDPAVALREQVIAWRRSHAGGTRRMRRILHRPCSGFNPLIYAEAHPRACLANRRYPLAHWIEQGQPPGPWAYEVIHPGDAMTAGVKVALHGHFFYADLLPEMLTRLERGATRPDLFLTTDSEAKVAQMRAATKDYPSRVDITIVPNLGRDIGPFFTALREPLLKGDYDVFFHVHGKKTKGRRRNIGDPWRNFLWENMIGGAFPMLDSIVARFAEDPTTGLVFPEDSHVLDWGRNEEVAQTLRRSLGLDEPMTTYVEFPVGNMFAVRPAALAALLDLDLRWEDYPAEPVLDDGTLLHGLERILPLVVRKAGYRAVAARVPGTYWED
ncbi:rhamnan synthesis F family protein [Ancylobacter sp. VNQ12]|uniref:rhamnan synthesis F family protein n=1 Tax=Ancylobacter sp. VNQ12 TaxID=3400920 RepID=UPI003BFEE5C7